MTSAGLARGAVTLTDFQLAGDLSGGGAAFTLTAVAHVDKARGESLDLLTGPVALTAFDLRSGARIEAGEKQFSIAFDRSGTFPIRVQFSAAVRQNDGWNSVDFAVAPSVLQPIVLRGLAADTQFQFTGAARPQRQTNDFLSYLPADGAVKFSWKEARPESEGKLFFSAGMLSQVSVSPGLMRQVALLDFKVMQGELNRVSLRLRGAGEVTRVQGDQVLAWNVEPITNSSDRLLVVQLNQPQKDQFSFQVQAQTPLGAFPQTADVLQLRPENATRFAGTIRLVNEGAVRLEVVQSSGLSQISPSQFPENDVTRAAFRVEGNQRFAYRFAGGDFALRAQADQILPELTVSEMLAYRAGESELAVDAELELDIREAPLRELVLRVPKGFAVAKLNAAGSSDYFLTEPAGASNAELRIVYGQPTLGRQLVDLRLEHNQGLGEGTWNLPRLEVAQAKSVRGFIGVAAEPGLRMTAERTKALTEIAMAFYPGKLDGIQAAFRLTDSAWDAAIHIERLPQTVQASALHLFSIGEGVAYGSSVINYVVTGAPVGTFQIELSGEYDNVEFTGKDIRNWQKTARGYTVQLHTPVSGAYTLLATYERPFKAQGQTLGFTGARPLGVQSEEGYTLVTSAYQFDVKPENVSPGLLALEPGEVPSQYRLFFDAPVLAAYRYVSRPFDLTLSLHPLAQRDSLSQIVDRASLVTHISKEGQALTDVRYFIKSSGSPNFRLTVPDGAQLWSATVNGAAVVPVQDGKASLVPLPHNGDPNAVVELDLKLASRSEDPGRLNLAAPAADAPVMLAEWKLEPDPGRRLVYEGGSIQPAIPAPDVSGFAQLFRLLTGEHWAGAVTWLLSALALSLCAVVVWRWASRARQFWLGAAMVALEVALAAVCLAHLGALAESAAAAPASDLAFLAPVQQSGMALKVSVSNITDKTTARTILAWGWPALASLALWLAGRRRLGNWAVTGGWVLLAWTALAIPNGAPLLLWVLGVFLAKQILPPIAGEFRHRPRGAAPLAASTVTALIAGGLLLLTGRASAETGDAIPESVTHVVRIEKAYAFGTAKIHWRAARGQTLPLLAEPAVLTQVNYPTHSLELTPGRDDSKVTQQLVAKSGGVFDIEVQYQEPITTNQSIVGCALPVPYGLINQLNLTVEDLDVDVSSSQAVSIRCDYAGSNTVASLVLSPGPASIHWQPRRRDVKREKPVFYAEVTQLYAPTPGVIEGAHLVSIRPAQGQLDELVLTIPPGATVTDVIDPNKRDCAGGSIVSLWRFDPDAGKLRVTLNPPQSRPFTILVRSQLPAKPLPFQQTAGLVAVAGAQGQIGLTGIATGPEVQLDDAAPRGLSPINLEDFPGDAVGALQGEIPGLTLRRAFRYSDTNATVTLRAAAVEPDVQVESDDTLSLGEDRTVLADNFTANITRAGIFELSFVMPAGFEVETISSPALSQWTELKTGAGRVITLHLQGKLQGQQLFQLTLSGPGVRSARHWNVPQVVLREASKQRGSLLVVPEQGMRLQVAARDGYTQLDPQKSGIRQKGVLGFRALQAPATLALDIEQVDPWVQVSSLQRAAVTEAQIKVAVNLQYQIENTGLKNLRVLLPTNAEGVRFDGEQVESFLQAGAATNGARPWEIKLRRRVIGEYFLQASYQIPLGAQATNAVLRGVEAANVNLQRGFVTVQSDPRLQITVAAAPPALQPAEWQGIPRALQRNLPDAAANFTWRLVEPSFSLPLALERHAAAKLLAARVNNIHFQSVIADDGVMLTRARLEIIPGEKRLLEVTLPPGARFWFAFVNDNGVWPWRDGDKILVPLEQPSGNTPVTVEIYHSCRAGSAAGRSLDLSLLAPKFDLPLENITWTISLGDKWRIDHWSGSLQLQRQELAGPVAADTRQYLENENNLRQQRTAEAEKFFALGNNSLQNGDPQEARRAFAAAYNLSPQDAAFNEDARVQLNNIKLQQALVGLNVSQSAAAGDPGALGLKLRDLRNGKELKYTQQDAKDIIDVNNADENAAFMRLAGKLIQQQDAAASVPAVIRATVPEQGRLLTFQRSVAVDPWADLSIGLQASVARTTPMAPRLWVLFAVIGLFVLMGYAFRRSLAGN